GSSFPTCEASSRPGRRSSRMPTTPASWWERGRWTIPGTSGGCSRGAWMRWPRTTRRRHGPSGTMPGPETGSNQQAERVRDGLDLHALSLADELAVGLDRRRLQAFDQDPVLV